MKTLTQAGISDRQQKHITRMIGDIADHDEVQRALAVLSKDGAERLKGSDFAQVVRNFVIAQIGELSATDKFKDEEVSSTYGYLSGYQPKGLTEQCNQLRILFPGGLGFPNQILLTRIKRGELELPKGAEGWFAIPNWIKHPQIFGTTYSEAVQKVLDLIKQTRDGKFYNCRAGQITEQQLRQSACAQKFFEELAETQGQLDILIVSAQFGLRHRGRSVRRAREVIAGHSGECGLGAFAVGIMLLTHPERLKHYDDLWIDCAGDEFNVPDGAVRFGHAPVFYFYGGGVRFGSAEVSLADGYYGSASGLPPQR